MFNEAGPSRLPLRPPLNGPGIPGRPSVPRRESDYDGGVRERDRDERNDFRSAEPSSSRQPWSRPPPRGNFRPYPYNDTRPAPRSHTPSPPRRFSRDSSRERERERDRDRMRDRDRVGDVRDRLSLEPGWRNAEGPPRRGVSYGSTPVRDRAPDWDRDKDRRWERERERDRRDERFREDGSGASINTVPGPRRFSPPLPLSTTNRPHSPPRGPRAFAPPSAYTPTSRIPSGPRGSASSTPTARDDRDRSGFQPRELGRVFDRPNGSISTSTATATPGPGPSSTAHAPAQPPRAPRSMRGSSSPVELKSSRLPQDGPSTVPSSTIALPSQSGAAETPEGEDGELEEGEVVSPLRTRPPRSPWGGGGGGGYRRSDRRSLSPPRLSRRSPPHWQVERKPFDRARSRGRSISQNDRYEAVRDTPVHERPTSPERPASPDRPPTPPIPDEDGAVDGLTVDQGVLDISTARPDTPVLPESQSSSGTHQVYVTELVVMSSVDTLRPITPDLPDVEQPKVEVAKEEVTPHIDENDTETNVADLGEEGVLTSAKPLEVQKRESLADTAPLETGTPVSGDVLPASVAPNATIRQASAPAIEEGDDSIETPQLGTAPVKDTFRPAPSSPNNSRGTIAERRAVQLPPTEAPLTSPFNGKFAVPDPMPTADSARSSTDAEIEFAQTPREENAMENLSPVSESAFEAAKEASIVALIKAADPHKSLLDIDEIYAWNSATVPKESSRTPLRRIDRNAQLDDIIKPLATTHYTVSHLVAEAIQRERDSLQEKTKRLQIEYAELDEEWQEHCKFLDEQMEKRGPPPAELFAIPHTMILPVTTPGIGPIPTTPLADDAFGRGNRRRGVGDAVTTEAEFQEILAGLADTAAKDPNYRASKTTAVVPDMLLGSERLMRYDDDNDLVTDPLAFYDFAGTAEPIWTSEERAAFLRRYLNFPKQFGKIAEALPDKTASDCVLYYYRTKKTIDYKGMLASRRGVTKKKAMPIKKSGKSSALLADLTRQKPTINPAADVPGKSAITPARSGKDSRGSKGRDKDTTVGTPGVESAIKRRKGVDLDDGLDSSEGPSRAGSETPALRGKLRMTMKGKRPRVSSIGDPTRLASQANVNGTAGELMNGQPQSDLLPPVKRAGKRRKVVEVIDPNNPDVTLPNGLPPAVSATAPMPTPGPGDKPRRAATNSYWSVDEKRRFRELQAQFGDDIKSIADGLPGKSVRQVGNFLEANRDGGTGARDDDRSEDRLNGPIPAYSRQYDIYATAGDRYPSDRTYAQAVATSSVPGPRLGMFPPSPHLGQASLPQEQSAPRLQPGGDGSAEYSPVKPMSRPGGMRISALLNDEPANDTSPVPVRNNEKRNSLETVDAASDGTVDEEGIPRASPRAVPPGPLQFDRRPSSSHSGHGTFPHEYSQGQSQGRPDIDRYRSAPGGAPTHPNNPGTWRGNEPVAPYFPPPPPRTATAPPHTHPVSGGAWDGYTSRAPYHPPPYRHPGHPHPHVQAHVHSVPHPHAQVHHHSHVHPHPHPYSQTPSLPPAYRAHPTPQPAAMPVQSAHHPEHHLQQHPHPPPALGMFREPERTEYAKSAAPPPSRNHPQDGMPAQPGGQSGYTSGGRYERDWRGVPPTSAPPGSITPATAAAIEHSLAASASDGQRAGPSAESTDSVPAQSQDQPPASS